MSLPRHRYWEYGRFPQGSAIMIGRSWPISGDFLTRTQKGRPIKVLPVHAPYILSIAIAVSQGGRCHGMWYLCIICTFFILRVYPELYHVFLAPALAPGEGWWWLGTIFDASLTVTRTFFRAEQQQRTVKAPCVHGSAVQRISRYGLSGVSVRSSSIQSVQHGVRAQSCWRTKSRCGNREQLVHHSLPVLLLFMHDDSHHTKYTTNSTDERRSLIWSPLLGFRKPSKPRVRIVFA